jgi:hypothetical protein
MIDPPNTVYRPHPSISREQARSSRAKAWSFVFRCWQAKQATAERADTSDVCREGNGLVRNQ